MPDPGRRRNPPKDARCDRPAAARSDALPQGGRRATPILRLQRSIPQAAEAIAAPVAIAVEPNFAATVEPNSETRVDRGRCAVIESVLAADQEVTEEETIKDGALTTAGVGKTGPVEP